MFHTIFDSICEKKTVSLDDWCASLKDGLWLASSQYLQFEQNSTIFGNFVYFSQKQKQIAKLLIILTYPKKKPMKLEEISNFEFES